MSLGLFNGFWVCGLWQKVFDVLSHFLCHSGYRNISKPISYYSLNECNAKRTILYHTIHTILLFKSEKILDRVKAIRLFVFSVNVVCTGGILIEYEILIKYEILIEWVFNWIWNLELKNMFWEFLLLAWFKSELDVLPFTKPIWKVLERL